MTTGDDIATNHTGDASDDEIDLDEPRTRNWVFPAIAAIVIIGFAVATILILRGPGTAKAEGPEGVPVQKVPDLAPASSTVNGTPVNGITCRSSMGQSVKYHIHQHVMIFVNGKQMRIPAGVGITKPWWVQHIDGYPFINNSAKSCVYWLHTHANDGIIHVESPTSRVFTLGDFFDIWNQPLTGDRVGPSTGKVVAYLDGKRVSGSPRLIPLTDHGVIQLNVGEPQVPFRSMHFEVKNVCGDGTLSCSPEKDGS